MPTCSTPSAGGQFPAGGADLHRLPVTAVGLTCACAEFFAQYLPFSYRTLVFVLGLFSMAVSTWALAI